MEEVQFNPNGGVLTAKAVFLGNYLADYKMLLREKNSNQQSLLLEGDNQNSQDDQAVLPTPVNVNDGRRVILKTAFTAKDATQYLDYKIKLQIYQDGNLIGEKVESGELTDGGQYSLLFIKLKSN